MKKTKTTYSDSPVKKAFIFTTRGSDKLSNSIAWFSAPSSWWLQIKNVPSHTGLLFERESGEAEYFESHSPEGWRGPKPVSKLEAWVSKRPKQWVRYRDLDLNEDECAKLYDMCKLKLLDPSWMDYPEHQILQMAMSRLFKKPVRRSKGVICSEAVGKLLFPYYDLRLWAGKKPISFDEMTPWWCQVVPLVRRGEESI